MKILILCFAGFFMTGTTSFSQTVTGKLKFTQGQVIEITMQVKTKSAQEAMGQSFDLDVDGLVTHEFKVTNTTEDNTTLRHTMKRISFTFDGMGDKRTFDSDKPKDLTGQMGKPMKDLLAKTYDMVIDATGKVMMVLPEKIETSNSDQAMTIILNMMKDLVSTVQPPKKNEASFFKLLPDTPKGIGETWTETTQNESGKSSANFKITDINESTVVIEFSGQSATNSKTEMMGMETTTSMNDKITGKIILDRASGLMRKKSSTTDSQGSMEIMGGKLPVTSKTTIEITVKPGM